MIIKKIVYLSLLTSILFTIKLIFGFIAAIEFVTVFILLYAVFLPLNWTLIITVSFIILSGIFYGFGPWWIMYWFIWPIEVVLTWLLRRILSKNNILFAFWAAFWGLSIILWYLIPNYIIGGIPFVIAQFISGILFNIIEGVCEFIGGILLFYPIRAVFHRFILNNPNISKKEIGTEYETY